MQAAALHAATGRADSEIIHEKRKVIQLMDFVLVREDYKLAKPHPERLYESTRLFTG